MLFKASVRYGDALNNYDALKLLALLTMIIDHLGYYFFPEKEWLRAIGRMAFPLFLFLVGYSGVWKIRADILVFAVLIEVCAVLTHQPVFPLNILVTIAFTRCLMPWLTRGEISPARLSGIFIASIVWYPFMMLWCDYGTLGVLFAVSGYLQRQKPESRVALNFLYMTLAVHFFIQYASFKFYGTAAQYMILVAVAAAFLMRHFRLETVQSAFLGAPVRRTLQWAARNTLPLYALHLMLFMVLERLWLPARLAHFRWFS